MDAEQIYEKVQERYGSAAKTNSGEYGRKVAKAFGYTEDELGNIPQDANLGLSCGNPLALAKLSEVGRVFSTWLLVSDGPMLMDGYRGRQSSISAAAQVSTYFSQQRGSASTGKSLEST
jgi:hypothetical protein